MNQKKDVYEHLAQTYLDQKKGKRNKFGFKPNLNIKVLFFLNGIILIFILASLFYVKKYAIKPRLEKFYLEQETVKLNYNFSNPDIKKQAYTLEFAAIDLRHYQYLSFSAREIKASEPSLILRIEIENELKEKTESYIPLAIENYWKTYKVDLKDFKKINDWSIINKISFVAEEWNTKEKAGQILIENICVIKERR